MQLNTDQLNQIKTFIRSRGFTHIEVEMEILDHVATAVEQKMSDQPELSLEKAIELVHQSFGVMGFSVFEDELKANLGKRISRTFSQLVWLHLSSKKLIRVILTAVALYVTLAVMTANLQPESFKIVAYIFVAIVGMIPSLYHRKLFKEWRQKSLVMGKLLWPFIFGSFASVYLIQLLPLDIISPENKTMQFLMASLATVISITTWCAFDLTREVYEWTNEKWLKFESVSHEQ